MQKSFKTTLFTGVLVNTMIFTISVFASGGGGNFYQSTFDRDYDIGKKVFFERVTCESCPHASLELNSNSVAEILPDLQRTGAIGKLLTVAERKSVKLFVKRRFNL